MTLFLVVLVACTSSKSDGSQTQASSATAATTPNSGSDKTQAARGPAKTGEPDAIKFQEAADALIGKREFMFKMTDLGAYMFAERVELGEGGGTVVSFVFLDKAGKREEHEVEDASGAAARTWLHERLKGHALRPVPGTPWPDGAEKLDLGPLGTILFDGDGTLTFPGDVALALGNDEFGIRPDRVFADEAIVGVLVRELSPWDQQVYMTFAPGVLKNK